MIGFDTTNNKCTESPSPEFRTWDDAALNAVGMFIEFWGFKHNHGRLWAYLYLTGKPRTAAEIQEDLGLSKGAVSMITRELEHWGVLDRTRSGTGGAWSFRAETDLMAMVSRVVERREGQLVERVLDDLREAEFLAQGDEEVPPEVLQRLVKLRRLGEITNMALGLFLKTADLDARGMMSILTDGAFGKRESATSSKKTTR